MSDTVKVWLSLPFQCSGLELVNPCFFFKAAIYFASKAITQPLVYCLRSRLKEVPSEVWKEQECIISQVSTLRMQKIKNSTQQVREKFPLDLQGLMDIACERGASVCMAICAAFDLHKGSFKDAICICYGWYPTLLPSVSVCGTTFLLTILSLVLIIYGGFPTLCHNELRSSLLPFSRTFVITSVESHFTAFVRRVIVP